MCTILPNFVAIAHTIAEIWRYKVSQNGGIRHLGFLKVQSFAACRLNMANMCQHAKCRDWSNSYRDMVICFQNGVVRHLEF